MLSGLLSGRMTRERVQQLPEGDWRRRALWFQEPNLTLALDLVERLKEIGARHGVSPAEVAIAWTLRHPPSRRRSSAHAGQSRWTGSSTPPRCA